MEDTQIAALADACRAPQHMKIAVATLIGIADAATLKDQELTAALTDGIMKLTEEKSLTRIQKLLAAGKDKETPPRQEKPTSVTVRQELKIAFSNYTSINRQIESASQRGYSEAEIQEALVSAMPLDLPMRNYLEVAKLDLRETCRLIQQHFKEPSATELFATLTNASQAVDENATTFMMRLLDKRERIKLAAKQSKEASYPDALIDATYRQSLMTGLADVELRITVRDLIERKSTDNEILAEINKMMASSQERASKHCDALKAQQQQNMASEQSEHKKRKRSEDTTALLEHLNAKVQALEAQLKAKSSVEAGGFSQDKYKCDNCKRYKRQRCTHCWRCGSDTHLQRNCPQSRQKQQGNGNGSR